MEYSFDECMKMALEGSDAFEDYRKKLISELIERAHPRIQQRLIGVQFRIDLERRKAKTPMASCVKIFDLMMDHLICEHIPKVNMCISFPSAQVIENNKKAKIVSFPDLINNT